MLWQATVIPVSSYSEAGSVIAISPYIPGPHVLNWLRFANQELGNSLTELTVCEQKYLAEWKELLWEDDLVVFELYHYWQRVVRRIEREFGVRGLEVKPMNVKPRAHEQGIVWVVTDLAASLDSFSY